MGFYFHKLVRAQQASKVVKAAEFEVISKRQFTQAQRTAAAKTGEAMPDGSFPIASAEDLHNAVSLAGNAHDASEARAHIIRRAGALGLKKELPKSWGGGDPKKKPAKKD